LVAVRTTCDLPVSWFVTVIAAPETGELFASRTVPAILPVDWATAGRADRRTRRALVRRPVRDRFM
jgi:hypothetical protein